MTRVLNSYEKSHRNPSERVFRRNSHLTDFLIKLQVSKDGSQLSDWQIVQSRVCFVTLGEN